MGGFHSQNEDGVIDIREFIIALSVVCKPSKTLETIQLAFQVSCIFLLYVVYIFLEITNTGIRLNRSSHISS